MSTNQQRFDNDDGTDLAQELAQEWVSEHIENVCEAHAATCPQRYMCVADGDVGCMDEDGNLLRVPTSHASRCVYFADAVSARMEAMKEDAL